MIITLDTINSHSRQLSPQARAPSEYAMSGPAFDEEDYDDDLPEELGGRPPWVKPVAIGGGVLVAAGVITMIVKKRGK